jgi:hypothetical protein
MLLMKGIEAMKKAARSLWRIKELYKWVDGILICSSIVDTKSLIKLVPC